MNSGTVCWVAIVVGSLLGLASCGVPADDKGASSSTSDAGCIVMVGDQPGSAQARKVRDACQRLLQQEPGNSEARAILVLAHEALGEGDAARATLQAGADNNEAESLLLIARRSGSPADYDKALAAYESRLPVHPSGLDYFAAISQQQKASSDYYQYLQARKPYLQTLSADEIGAIWDAGVLNLYEPDGSLRNTSSFYRGNGFTLFADVSAAGHAGSVFALARQLHPDGVTRRNDSDDERNRRDLSQLLNQFAVWERHPEALLAAAGIPIVQAQEYFQMGGSWRQAAHSELNSAQELIEKALEIPGAHQKVAREMLAEVEEIRRSREVNWEVALPALIGLLATIGTFDEGTTTYQQGYESNQRAVACSTLVYGDDAHRMAAAMAWGC